MSLWVDKHRPRELSKLDYHKNQAEQLKNLCQQGKNLFCSKTISAPHTYLNIF
jgi:hypothetical protein